MKYLVCRNCNTIFSENDAKTRREYHPEVSTKEQKFYEVFLACPHCGSDDLDNASVCLLCKKPHDEATDLCETCHSKIRELRYWLIKEIINELFVGEESEEAEAYNAVEEVLCE